MSDAFLIDAVRTPRGKGAARRGERPGGALSEVPPARLLADLIAALLARHDVDPACIDDVQIGCAVPTGEQGTNVARLAALLAGLEGAPAAVVSRGCCSGLDALINAAAQVSSPMASVVLAGGVESMSRVPMFSDGGSWFADEVIAEATGFVHMAVAADLLATMEGIERDTLDGLAIESHRRAAHATDAGHFARSLVPVRDGDRVLLARDELIEGELREADVRARPGSFAELADEDARRRVRRRYPEVHAIEARHHRHTAPGLADAASIAIVADDAGARALGRAPRARIVSWAHAAVEPTLMLNGNVEASRRAIARAGLTERDVDLFEVNESFAAVPLHFARELGIDHARLNVDGGALAMGHPLGATGGVLMATLIDALEREDRRTGLVSICGAAGVATAIVIERV